MTAAFRIVQISDCHVSADPEALYRGLDARRGFELALEAALGWRPDLLLVTGDLSEDCSDASYAYLAGKLSECGLPVVTTPGNHDVADLQARHFPATAVDEPLVVEAGEWLLVVLNSSAGGQVSGRLSGPMCAGLEKVVTGSAAPKLIVLHHHPVPVDSHWIDRYPLEEPERLWKILAGRLGVRGVLWGHIHHAFRARRDGMLLLGAPATAANSHPFESEFRPDPAGPACRWIKLGADGSLASGIIRNSAGFRLPAEPATG